MLPNSLHFYLNGHPHTVHDPDPRTLLLDYLRSPEVGLTGAKKGCGQGGCGCCTVMLSNWVVAEGKDEAEGKVVHRSINSCMHPLASMDGMALTTIEGTGSTDAEVSPVQWAVAANNGSQCGYCTPGWVMTMHSAMAAHAGKAPACEEIEGQFDGNLCRCTGYRSILHGMKTLSPNYKPEGSMECKVDPAECPKQSCEITVDFADVLKKKPRAVSYKSRSGDYSWERALTLKQLHEKIHAAKNKNPPAEVKLVVGNTSIGIYPLYEDDPKVLIDISQIPELRTRTRDGDDLIVGAAVTYRELLAFLKDSNGGARKGLPKNRHAGIDVLEYMARRTAGNIIRNAASLAGNTMLVVRHVEKGTPFPSDLFTALACLEASLIIASPNSDVLCEFPILEFAREWAECDELRRDAVIVSYRIPIPPVGQYARTYKVALRHENSHSIVNAGLRVGFRGEGQARTVDTALAVFGGIGPLAFRAKRVEEALKKSGDWGAEKLADAIKCLQEDVQEVIDKNNTRMASVPNEGFSDDYRRHLAQSYLYQFFVYVLEQLPDSTVKAEISSAGKRVDLPVNTRGTQKYETFPDEYPVNEPYIKLTAFEQACGQAVYTHDLPLPRTGLEGAVVTSACSRARAEYQVPDKMVPGKMVPGTVDDVIAHLKKYDPSFVDYITCRDIQNANGEVLQGAGKDEPLLTPMESDITNEKTGDVLWTKGDVRWQGQPIGVVLAKDLVSAQRIAYYVQNTLIDYKEAGKDVATFEMVAKGNELVKGNPTLFKDKPPFPVHIWKIIRPRSEFDWVDTPKRESVQINGVKCKVIENRHQCGGQIHFYMETQSAFAERGPDNNLSIVAATQSPDSVVGGIHSTLGLPQNRIDVKVPHVGGAYGGKTTRSPFTASLAALAAWKTRRPVKLVLTREVDTAMVGHRHPLISKHQLAIGTGKDHPDNKGRLMGMKADYYFDGGYTYDCSFTVMDCLQLRGDSAYFVPNYHTQGEVCQTNRTSNTAYRAFGLIQAMVAYEDAIERAAHELEMSAEDIREKNLYRIGDMTPYGQGLDYCYMQQVWDYARTTTKFDKRREDVEEFNKKHRWLKRGISLMPLKYGSGYNLVMLEQGGALIEAFTDGSVLLRHGGVEMGQGVKTKITQIAAFELRLPLGKFETGVTDTHVVPNPISTGASTGTVLNGGAVKQAASMLRERLENYCVDKNIKIDYADGWRHPNGKGGILWDDIVRMANQDRVNLSVQVRYRQAGGTESDLEGKASGLVFHEGVTEAVDHFEGFTFSAACSEVLVNVLTGETQILQSDIIYDIGKSLNPAIDVGQVEGAFLQGVGFVLTEELVYQKIKSDEKSSGNLNTLNTWGYKPPATSTVPHLLNVDLFPLKDAAGVPKNPNDLFGAKEVGEPPLVLATTVYLAIKRAVLASRKERGKKGWFQLDAPATVQRVREACEISSDELVLDPNAVRK